MVRKIIIGTRESLLALWQASWVKRILQLRYPKLSMEIKTIKTQGDRMLNTALDKINDKALFTRELEIALLNKEIDIAVHSMKDLPTSLPVGLIIGAITERHDPADVVISKSGVKLLDLPKGAVVGTSSLRRRSQLLNMRQDFIIKDICGNLNTRIRKFAEQDYQAVVLAAAGIERLGWGDKITERLNPEEFLPAIGQGALGIEIRQSDKGILDLVAVLNHSNTDSAVRAERAMLRTLGGGCQTPVGALGLVVDDKLMLRGLIGSLDGTRILKAVDSGSPDFPEVLGQRLASSLIDQGAGEILKQIRN
ncbi:MAG: hydroxymethylbilane synthase [Actinobacteria bacterium]|nr:hydroxymethylbilane synthase [Actinomycetota bacterium]